MPEDNRSLREHLLYLLRGGGAHAKFEDAVASLPAGLHGKKPPKAPYTAWQLLEHMRIAQWDILEFCRNPNYQEMEWPAAYWPKAAAPPDEKSWELSIKSFRTDAGKFCKMIEDPGTDLFAPIPWGTGQTLLREALLVADHNSYHLGQLVLVRRLLGAWRE